MNLTPTPTKPKRKSKGKSPTARAMQFYRDLGFKIEKVEQRLPHTFITRDLFNIIDLVAMKIGVGIIGVQVTSGSNHASRRTKACEEPLLRDWLLCGARFEVLTFSEKCTDGRGSRKAWMARREELFIHDLTSDVNGELLPAAADAGGEL